MKIHYTKRIQMRSRKLGAAACLGFSLSGLLFAEAPSLVAIRNARVITVSGTTLDKGTVILKDGLIADVGASVSIPSGAWVIEGDGLTIYPGFIDGLSTWGVPEFAPVAAPAAAGRPAAPASPTPAPAPPAPQPVSRGPDDRPNTTSWLKVADLVKPADKRIEIARNAGFTTAITFPKQGIIAGHGAVVNLGGTTAGQMIVDPSSGLYVTLATGGFANFPSSLMGVIAYVRQLWIDAAYYRTAKEKYAATPSSVPRPDYDRALEGMLDVHRVLLPASSKVEIARMIQFAAELKVPAVLYGVHQGYRAADILKQAGVPVVVNAQWPIRAKEADPDEDEPYRVLETRDKAPTTPMVLAQAGVPFAFSSDGVETPKDVLRAVKKSIVAGLKPDQAVRAFTLSAAEIYGVAGRLGSIDRGKIANLTIVKGDIFDDKSQVQMVFIDGVKYDPVPEAAPPGPQGPARTEGPPREARQ
jgi:imidazolonepropionase-like amidohydrolase